MHSALPDVQSAYNHTTLSYGKAFEGQAFLEQAHEIITEDEEGLFHLLTQAQEKLYNAVVATREAEQALVNSVNVGSYCQKTHKIATSDS